VTPLKDLLNSKKNDIANHVRSHRGARILWLACANLERDDDSDRSLSLFGNIPAAVRFMRSQGAKDMNAAMAQMKEALLAGKMFDGDVTPINETVEKAKELEKKENMTMHEFIADIGQTPYGQKLVQMLDGHYLLD
jgi:hypothetical protein